MPTTNREGEVATIEDLCSCLDDVRTALPKGCRRAWKRHTERFLGLLCTEDPMISEVDARFARMREYLEERRGKLSMSHEQFTALEELLNAFIVLAWGADNPPGIPGPSRERLDRAQVKYLSLKN